MPVAWCLYDIFQDLLKDLLIQMLARLRLANFILFRFKNYSRS